MGLRVSLVAIVISIMSLSTKTEAAWQGPVEIISGTWGPNNDQFGIKYGDTNDAFAGPIYVKADGDIVIQDVINGRYKVYSADGTLKKSLKCIEVSRDVYNDECNFDGDYLQAMSDGNIWTDQSKYKHPKFSLYSPIGQLIKTSTTRPLEFGMVKEIPDTETQYKIEIQYPDKTYILNTESPYIKYVRTVDGLIHAVNPGGVWRFDQCGRQIGELLMPKQGAEPVSVPGTGKYINIAVEYGEPVVAPNGDVYAWKKTDINYSILKWTWVDDPNVPTGPDAPNGLAVTASTSGLYLTWQASPQDPGCVTGYEVVRATSAGGSTSTIATVDKGVLKYNDTTASAGTTYYYKVRAKAGSEYSPYSSEVAGKR